MNKYEIKYINNCIELYFNKEFFEKESVLKTLKKFSTTLSLDLIPFDEQHIKITIHANDNYSLEESKKLFCNELFDQQIREDLAKQYNPIREIIYKRAFETLYKN